MAVDTIGKKVSATLSFPHALGVWPSGTVDRLAAAWVYSTVASAPSGEAIGVTLALLSEITKTLVLWSRL